MATVNLMAIKCHHTLYGPVYETVLGNLYILKGFSFSRIDIHHIEAFRTAEPDLGCWFIPVQCNL